MAEAFIIMSGIGGRRLGGIIIGEIPTAADLTHGAIFMALR